MEEEKLDEMLKTQPDTPVVKEKLRTPVTILFSDIKGSTAYFEQKGDIEGLAMVERHNKLLFPCVETNHGRIVKTIGDAIMALFNDPVDAVHAAVQMQVALDEDAKRADFERIHIRIGVHTGLGLMHGDDVFGDVVNAAARVQGQSEPDQILITDSLLSAVKSEGFQVGKLGRARMKGKDEPIDIYAVGWSPSATQRLIDDLQKRFDEQLRELKQSSAAREEEFDRSRGEWAEERRRLNVDHERLEEAAKGALETARGEVTGEFQKQVQFKVEAAEKARRQSDEDSQKAQERFESERVAYKAQIANLENRLVESMEQVNNPARAAAQVRDQVQARVAQAKDEWQAQWDAERKRLTGEIEKAKNSGPKDPMAEARRLMMERIKAKQEGGPPSAGGPDLTAEHKRLERERGELKARVKNLEKQVQQTEENVRREVYSELRHSYDQKTEHAERARSQLEQEIRTLTEELAAEKQSASSRIRQLEEAIPAAEEAARVQAGAELKSGYDLKLEEADRTRARLDRRYKEAVEQWDLQRDRLEKQMTELESHLQQARDMAFKRSSDPTVDELNRLRRQLEEEFRFKNAEWGRGKATIHPKDRKARTSSKRSLTILQSTMWALCTISASIQGWGSERNRLF